MSSISSFYQRRASIKSASKPEFPTVISFRNAAGEVQYTSAPSAGYSHATPQQTSLAFQSPEHQYDSDAEPLLRSVTRSSNFNDLTEEEKARFTATGRPIPTFVAPSLQTWGGDMFTVPQFLPKQYTDDSIIPAIVTNVILSKSSSPEKKKKKGKSISAIFKGEKNDDFSKGLTKVVFMPRREYLKYFAKDDKGVYVGTEPQKQWSEEELDEKFGAYRPTYYQDKGKMSLGTFDRMTTAGARGQA